MPTVQSPARSAESVFPLLEPLLPSVQKLLEAIHPVLAEDAAMARAETMLLFGMINWTHTWFDPAGPVSADQFADMALDRILAPISPRRS